MSPKNKSKRRASTPVREKSPSKPPSRSSTCRQGLGSGPATKDGAKSGPGESKKQRRGARETPDGPSEMKPRRRRRLRKRVPIGEALRKQGLDEHTIADTYAQVVDNLKGKKRAGSNEKLLVEILKECTRQIEATPPAGEGAIQVKLVHNVERPKRVVTAEKTAPKTTK